MARARGEPELQVRKVSPATLRQDSLTNGIKQVYLDAFGAPPYHENHGAAEAFVERLHAQTGREAYRLLVAQREARVLGFAYGHALAPGQWWFDRVTPALAPDVVERWFPHAYGLVELAVHSSARGTGIGGSLHDRLLQDLPHRTAVTMAHEAAPAVAFYRARGWRTLTDGFRFHERDRPRLILGLELESGLAAWEGADCS